MKKLLASLIILTLIVSSFSFVAFATTAAFTIEYADGTTATATSLANAITLANEKTDGTLVTITMNQNVTHDSSSGVSVATGVNVLLDLNNYKLTLTGSHTKSISVRGSIEVKNGSIERTSSKEEYVFWMSIAPTTAPSKLTINNVNIKNINGGGVGSYLASSSYDADTYQGSVVTVNGAETVIDVTGVVFYGHVKKMVYIINDGTFTTSNSIELDGKRDAKGKIVNFQDGNITINGGSFENTTNTPVDMARMSGGKLGATVSIKGGTFPCDVSQKCKSGYYSNKVAPNKFVVENKATAKTVNTMSNSFKSLSSAGAVTYVTCNTTYKTLQAALDDTSKDTDVKSDFVVPENPPIVLLANNIEGAVANRPLTITKNGFTANVTAGEGYVLKETETAYVVEEAPSEVTVAQNITASYDDGKGAGTKTSRFFADINTLDVAEAGFEVSATVEGVKYTWTIALNEVYSTVVANDVTYNATNYIITGAIGDIPNSFEGEFDVKVYTKDFEGNTKYIG